MDSRNHLLNRTSLAVIILLWVAMVLTLLFNSSSPAKRFGEKEPGGTSPDGYKSEDAAPRANIVNIFNTLKQQHHQLPVASRPSRVRATLTLPKRYTPVAPIESPPPLEEIRANMSVYLHELHNKLEALAGPRVSAITVWETFLNATKTMPMVS